MKQGYVCDYCGAFFDCETNAEAHEKHCTKNPSNKVNDKTLHRVAMILKDSENALSCALSDMDTHYLEFLVSEIERTGTDNCFYLLYDYKYRIAAILRDAMTCKCKRRQLITTKYEECQKKYPELLDAFKKILGRPACNEH